MKYIITENKMEKVILHFLNEKYGDLEEYRTDKNPDNIFYVKDDKKYMELDLENKRLWVDRYTIWTDLEEWFSLGYDDIKQVINKWVEDTYNIRGVKPRLFYFY